VLNQWETWFDQMDEAGITIYLFLYDDSARIWDTGNSVGTAEQQFVQGIVNRFEHHANLIWVVAEEYEERYTPTRVSNIAAVIRGADNYDHPIAVHQLGGLDFSALANDPNIDQYSIQYNQSTADLLHAGMVQAFNTAAGRYNLNLSEAASWGSGATARRKAWAAAMGGAYVMGLGMDVAGTPLSDLQDLGRLRVFMEGTEFVRMSPRDDLANGATQYVLADPDRSYIVYASNLSGSLGLKSITAGTYEFMWFDVVTGAAAFQTRTLAAGNQVWSKPAGIGNELALYIRRVDAQTTTNAPPTAHNQSYTTQPGTPVSVSLSYSDFDGPGPYSFTITSPPAHGTLSGTGANRTYTPNTGFTGTDTMSFRVNDGQANSNNATIKPLRIEAESMTLSTYSTESSALVSGGSMISLKGGAALESGVATWTYSGPSGQFNVVIGYIDENDGVAQLEVRISGQTIEERRRNWSTRGSTIWNCCPLARRTFRLRLPAAASPPGKVRRSR
jgi:hypothetical protein